MKIFLSLIIFTGLNCFAQNLKSDSCDLNLPTAFIPEGEMEPNKTFGMSELMDLKEFSFEIADQNQELIFSTNNQNLRWDGTDKQGELLPQAQYFWTIKFITTSGCNQEQTGKVFLLRVKNGT